MTLLAAIAIFAAVTGAMKLWIDWMTGAYRTNQKERK